MSNTKTLSNTTLGLKFMQNARRSQQQKEVAVEKAAVKDEAEWEVSKAVREAWGMSSGSNVADTHVHEDSYLPFLFSESSTEEPESRPRGRRIFGARGEEIEKQLVEEAQPNTESELSTSELTNSAGGPGKGRKVHSRPVSISATAGSSGLLRGFDEPISGTTRDNKASTTTTKSARQAVFETGSVGIDLRDSRQRPPSAAAGTSVGKEQQQRAVVSPSGNASAPDMLPMGFMKPAGVDEPPSRPSGKPSDDHTVVSKPKRKRQTQGTPSELDDRAQKQKKIKKSKNLT